LAVIGAAETSNIEPTMRTRLLIFLVACVAVVIGYVAITGSDGEQGSREEELQYLRVVLPDEHLGYANLEVSSREALIVGEEGADRYLGLRVFPGQKRKDNRVRAEISVDYPFRPGDRVRYSWRFRVPEDFVTDAPANRWWVIGQWHDQPDQRLGESWDQFPSRSPPIVLGVGELDGRVAISLGYGPTTGPERQQEFGPLWIERGKWHDLAIEIFWSSDADGHVELFLDNATEPSLAAQGPNMNNGYQHYWKVGQYRHPDINTDNRIDIADLRVHLLGGRDTHNTHE
jgi:hypothetical protein